ncbi:MAG: site-2 protease family protein, partial [Patescibacteria group bacterium]
VIFGLLLRFSGGFGNQAFVEVTTLIVFINIVLAIFNLIPVPPLDGSKLLFALFPERLAYFRNFYERFGIVFIILVIFFAGRAIVPLAIAIFSLFTGVGV